MIAVVLCGGKGTRLAPLTNDIPKSLVPVQGKPIIEHILDLFYKYGIKNIILSVGYLKEKMKEHFSLNADIKFLEEDVPLGTAGPLKLLEKQGNFPKETFVMCNGDELKEINVQKMIAFHKESKALVTIALTEVNDPSSYGVARMNGNRISEFIEKPKKEEAPSNLINSGFYIMEPEIIDFVPEGFASLERDVFPKVAKAGRLFAFPFKGQWFPTDTFERLGKAEKEWKGISV
jgi:NDP-sugar pyrophosphorylase family protein